MTNDIKISRELLERLAERLSKAQMFKESSELRALLAAPVVEAATCIGDLERFESDGEDFVKVSDVIDMLGNMKAAPVVESQEPVYQVAARLDSTKSAWIDVDKESFDDYATRGNSWLTRTLYTSQPAPVAADIAHDRAYRNGLMAGFQFGISGNEKGYAVAIANFNSEIHAAKGEAPAPAPAPVAVVLPERSNQDYAIEHAEYMALSADDVLAKFQTYGLALLAVDEGGDDGEGELFEAIDSARQDLQESLLDLRGMVYEFRKRSNRCTPQ